MRGILNFIMWVLFSRDLQARLVLVGLAVTFVALVLIVFRARGPTARRWLARIFRVLKWASVAAAVPPAILAIQAWCTMMDSQAVARAAARGTRVDGTSLALFAITMPIATLVCLGAALGWRWLEWRVRRAPG